MDASAWMKSGEDERALAPDLEHQHHEKPFEKPAKEISRRVHPADLPPQLAGMAVLVDELLHHVVAREPKQGKRRPIGQRRDARDGIKKKEGDEHPRAEAQ
ncbi:hypothetical protein HY095_05625 [Candidatus Micrarchaeota archaeon]|nr:hypothetical protein [Candidatus Micrarchaeota archaeon]